MIVHKTENMIVHKTENMIVQNVLAIPNVTGLI